MTVDTSTTGGGALAVPDDGFTGLEDFDASTDAVMPRIKIVGKEAMFEDNLTGEKHDKISVILLGLVKQRILWDAEVEENAAPMCRSLDFQLGLPASDFPTKVSGFDRALVEAAQKDGGGPALPCASCNLKEWGTNPRGSTPWCSEQHTYPLLMEQGIGSGIWQPAILTLQRSGIKASKAYITGFARSRTPLYTAKTLISLQAQKRGSVDYAVPVISRAGATEQGEWPEYAQTYRNIRSFLTTPRVTDDDDEGSSPTVVVEREAPAAAAKPPKAPAGVTRPAPVVEDDDEEPPF
jgi:hypothetical protein